MPPKRAQNGQETRPVSFRMPLDVYRDLAEVAESRGVDLSAVLNWMCAEYRPVLLRKKAEQEAAMLRAKATDLWEIATQGGDVGEGLRTIRQLLNQIQEVYAALSKQLLAQDERRAG